MENISKLLNRLFKNFMLFVQTTLHYVR